MADGETGASRTLGEAVEAQTVGGTAVDGAGNVSRDDAGALRVDLSNPLVTCDGEPMFLLGQTDAHVAATVADAISGPVDATIAAAVGTAAVGTFTTSFTGRDRCERSTSVECVYRVVYDWGGFSSRLEQTTAVRAKAGSAVPLTFSLNGNFGLGVIEPGDPRSQQVTCDTAASLGPEAAAASPGAAELSHDAESGTYTWIWKTDRRWQGTCRVLTLKLNDGTSHDVLFRLE